MKRLQFSRLRTAVASYSSGLVDNDLKIKIKQERLSKLIAKSGLGSRRDAEIWIKDGRVSVNGKVIVSPAMKVTSLLDSVIVDGIPVGNYSRSPVSGESVYTTGDRPRIWAIHKVRGELVGNSHDRNKGRPLLMDRMKKLLRGLNPEHLKPVDRLDFNTEGLLLMTNSASLSRYLNSDSAALQRVHKVRVHGLINEDKIRAMQRSLIIKNGMRYKPFAATLDRQSRTISWITMTNHEDRTKAIDLVLNKLALRPLRIIRTDFGPFSLGNMPAGAIQEIRLTPSLIHGWMKSV